MTLPDIGIIDSLAFLAGILIEIPSGILSDKFGRKFSVLVSNLFQFGGSFLITTAENRYEIGVGFIIFQIGVSLYSGSIEALGYESTSSDAEYQKVITNSVNLGNVSYLISLLVGGFFYNIFPKLPNFLWSLNYLFSMLLSVLIIDKPNKSEIQDQKTFDFRLILKNYFVFTILLIVISFIVFVFEYGFLKILILDTFVGIDSNYLIIFGVTFTSIMINFLHFNFFPPRERFLYFSYFLCSLLLIMSIFWGISNWILYFFLTYFGIILPQISMFFINTKVSDEFRASAISIYTFLYKAPYFVLAIVMGFSVTDYGINFVLLFLGILMLVIYLSGQILEKLYYNYHSRGA
jgi:MFS family permease